MNLYYPLSQFESIPGITIITGSMVENPLLQCLGMTQCIQYNMYPWKVRLWSFRNGLEDVFSAQKGDVQVPLSASHVGGVKACMKGLVEPPLSLKILDSWVYIEKNR